MNDEDIRSYCVDCFKPGYMKFPYTAAGYRVGKCDCGGGIYLFPNDCIGIVEEW